MNILITGGAGFIGSNLAIDLLNNNNNIYVIDNEKKPTNLCSIMKDLNYIELDIGDRKGLEDFFNKVKLDGIVHLAAVSRVVWGQQNPNLCFNVNTNGTRLLFESLKKINHKPWIIFSSSREVYGNPEKLPVCEDCKKIPVNIYGETKIMGENIIQEYSKELGLRSIILRFSNVYGNEKDIMDRVLPRFILAALKNDPINIHGGNQLIDFTHIDDTVNGIIKSINYLENNGKKSFTDDFHLLTGKGTSLQDAVKIISDHLGNHLKIKYSSPRNYDVDRFYGDPKKAYELLDFKANILPEVGLPKTIDQYKEAFNL